MRIVTVSGVVILLGHIGEPVAPHDLPGAWPVEPVVWGAIALAVILYVRGLRRLRQGAAGRRALPAWRAWCFAGGMFVVAVALVSPLDVLAGVLFSAHMFQHLLLTLLGAPLLVLGRPILVSTFGLSKRVRERVASLGIGARVEGLRSVWWAVGAVVAHAASMWFWHVPPVYEAGLRSDAVHAVEHVTLLAGAMPLWWLVADVRGRHANAAGVLAVFASVLLSGGLAGLITFSGDAWYPGHGPGVAQWGLTVLQDQQLAGGLMWFPGGLAYVVGGAVVFLRWLRTDERTTELRLQLLEQRTRDA